MKDEIRKKLKIQRAAFKGEQREQADKAILKRFLSEFGGYESYFIYNSFSTEADTKRIIYALLEANKRVYIPRVEGENMFAVPYGQTRKGAFGIDEPDGQTFEGDIDITVVPLLAVNERLYRIGFGKGYYDRYLKHKNTIKVGLGYSFQMAEFEEDEWDIPLDFYLCEKGVYGK